MNKSLLIAIFSVLICGSCKKNDSPQNSQPGFVSYFKDTTTKKTGLLVSGSRFIDSIPSINDIDTALLPVFQRLSGIPIKYEIEMPAVGNQGANESCVGWAAAYSILSNHTKVINNNLTYGASNLISPSFVWNSLNSGFNKGIELSEALYFLKTKGSCRLITMSGNAPFYERPTGVQIIEAINYRLYNSFHFDKPVSQIDLNQLKIFLSRNYCLVFGGNVDKGFSEGKTEPSFKKNVDGSLVWKKYFPEKTIGGHALVICGYDDEIQAFKVQNSWGTDWGNSGFIWIDYNLFKEVLIEDGNEAILYLLLSRKTTDINYDLVAYYPFNGNANDLSGNNNNGSTNGGISYVTDRKGNQNSAMYFDGNDAFVQIPSSQTLESPRNGITISAWIKAEEVSSRGAYFLCKTNTGNIEPFQYRAGFSSFNMYFGFKNTTSSYLDIQGPSYNLPSSVWKFVVYTYDGSKARFYIDGILLGEVNQTGSLFPDDKPLEIGRDAHGPIEWFKGALDDIRISYRALTQDEILRLKNE